MCMCVHMCVLHEHVNHELVHEQQIDRHTMSGVLMSHCACAKVAAVKAFCLCVCLFAMHRHVRGPGSE